MIKVSWKGNQCNKLSYNVIFQTRTFSLVLDEMWQPLYTSNILLIVCQVLLILLLPCFFPLCCISRSTTNCNTYSKITILNIVFLCITKIILQVLKVELDCINTSQILSEVLMTQMNSEILSYSQSVKYCSTSIAFSLAPWFFSDLVFYIERGVGCT